MSFGSFLTGLDAFSPHRVLFSRFFPDFSDYFRPGTRQPGDVMKSPLHDVMEMHDIISMTSKDQTRQDDAKGEIAWSYFGFVPLCPLVQAIQSQRGLADRRKQV